MGVLGEEQRLLRCSSAAPSVRADSLVGDERQDTELHACSHRLVAARSARHFDRELGLIPHRPAGVTARSSAHFVATGASSFWRIGLPSGGGKRYFDMKYLRCSAASDVCAYRRGGGEHRPVGRLGHDRRSRRRGNERTAESSSAVMRLAIPLSRGVPGCQRRRPPPQARDAQPDPLVVDSGSQARGPSWTALSPPVDEAISRTLMGLDPRAVVPGGQVVHCTPSEPSR